MARLFRVAMLMACFLFLSAGSVFAAGGTCPTAANYLEPNTASTMVTLSSLGITGCYYIAANGSDSNNGTSESTPWLHAPGMPACTSTCATVTPAAGEGFIFRGGDTWHLGNSSYATYTGGPFSETGSGGTTSNPIYWGVDQSWYAGSASARPIFNADNPTSTSPVASCAYDDDGWTGLFWYYPNNIVDNFEGTGVCWSNDQQNSPYGPGQTYFFDAYGTNNYFMNLYIHGWTHKTFSCTNSGGEPSGSCDGAIMLETDHVQHDVIDGSDTSKDSGTGVAFYCYDIEYSVFRYMSNEIVCNGAHLFHDNWMDHDVQSGDGLTHSNAQEFPIDEATGDNYFYNNVWSNNFATGSGVTSWFVPNAVDYFWNNVYWNNPGGQLAYCETSAQCAGASPGNKSYWWNNTIVDSGTFGTTLDNGSGLNLANNLLVNTALIGTPASQTNEISMTDAQAATAGITSGSTYPYQLTSSNCNGHSSPTCPVGAGANYTSSWPSGYSTSDATYACSYNTSSHSVSCPNRTSLTRPTSGAWDAGAYQSSGSQVQSQSQGPQAPSNLQATVK